MKKSIKEKFLLNEKRFEIGDNNYLQYEKQVRRLYEYFDIEEDENEEKKLVELTMNKIEDYFEELRIGSNYKFSTFNGILVCTKEFFNYLRDKRHLMEYNPCDVVRPYTPEELADDKTIKEVLTIDEIKKVINSSYKRIKNERNFEYNSVRDRFLVALLSTTGLRIEEALNIKMDWIEKTSNGIMINIPKKYVKNHIDKRVPLVDSIIKYYKQYLLEREDHKEKSRMKDIEEDLLFLSRRGKKIATPNSNELIQKLVKKAEIDKHITPHCFRHGLTQILISKGMTEEFISTIQGWKLGKGVINVYSGKANDKIYDKEKLKVCDFL